MQGKIVVSLFLIMVFSVFQLSGCTKFFSSWLELEEEPVEHSSLLPEWLLKSHRVKEDPSLAEEEPVLPELQVSEPGETDTVDLDLSNGDVDEDPANGTAVSQPQPVIEESAVDNEEEEEEIRPGTMAWIIKKKEDAEAAQKEKEEDAEKEEEEEEEWWELDEENGDSSIIYEKN
ncbi:MAG: hypothetical protein AVO34_00835 [Firmicutes bacterium ML8_F2]|jgi:hypothetical protein|nr:MAG: hypothetical protein AVO34_00835 [Firmicutes bacterium ML8_F2]